MLFKCGYRFSWPKTTAAHVENDYSPQIIKTTEEYLPRLGKATFARICRSNRVYLNRSMCPSPESIVKGEVER